MQPNSAVDRRSFLESAGAALTGLVLSGRFTLRGQERSRDVALNAWIRIASDNTVTLIASQAEMGQGAATTLPAILAEELGADWRLIRIANAPVGAAYQNPRINWQFTGNSESTTGFFDLLRRMGAAGREMLIDAAAERWNVPRGECLADQSAIVHRPSGRRLPFGEIVEDAARRTPPESPPLKPPAAWTLLGKPQPRLEVPDKLRGTAVFGVDFKLPGMAYAAIRLVPEFGGKPIKVDRSSVLNRPGVIDIVEIPDGVAVVADSFWLALDTLNSLPVEFAPGPNAGLDSAALSAQYRAALDGNQWTRVKTEGAAPTAGDAFTQDYESQFLAHATMEPMNCTASVTADKCEIWGPIQGQALTQLQVAGVLKLPPERVLVNRTLLGGGFGRRLMTDFAIQAALISRAVGRPVKVIWTRETDMTHDGYRPAVLHRISAKVDSRGLPISFSHRLVSPSILQYVYPLVTQAPYDPSCLEGTLEWHYKIPHWQVDFHQLKVGVPTSVLRTTGYGPNIFAIESMIDELAHRAKRDPYMYRRDLLTGNARALAVLDLVAEKSAWKRPPARGRFRGIAFAEAFRTVIAHVVELSVSGKAVRVHKITCAFDCGIALDPDICINSMEGGAAWGLTCAFLSEITFDKGGAVQTNFHDYPLLSIAQMPELETHFINSGASLLGGTGEVGPVTVVPAIVNALFAATGQRVRSLPLSRHGFELASSRHA